MQKCITSIDVKAYQSLMSIVDDDLSIPYRDWIGINFNENQIESIKFYFSFYSLESVNKAVKTGIIEDSIIDTFYELYTKAPAQFLNSFEEYGSGITFSVKWNNQGKRSTGIFYRLQNSSILPFEKILVENRLNEFSFEESKGVFILQDSDKQIYFKYYFYSNDRNLVTKFANKLELSDLLLQTKKIEISSGKGNIINSSDKDLKIILLGNELEISRLYLNTYCFPNQKTTIQMFAEENNLNIYCPAFYINKPIQSCYFFHIDNTSPFKITKTVNKIINA